MNYINNCLEIEKINIQLKRADLQKSRLICDIYREYEHYLHLVRDQLNTSIKIGLNELCNDLSSKNSFLNANEFICFFQKINEHIYCILPLITVEQLKIKKIDKNINLDGNFNGSLRSLQTSEYKREKMLFENEFQFENIPKIQISDDIPQTSEYYHDHNNEKLLPIDLDNNYYANSLFNDHVIENIGLEKQFISSILELVEEDKIDKTRYFERHNINQIDISPKHNSLKNFDLIDNSLEKLLLNLSYIINQELLKVNLLKKIISKDSFQYLVKKKLMTKHPHPFVINFEFNLNQFSSIGDKLSSIIFFYISTVELEFKNLNLSIQRNKINDLKNQFQRLIKKERYWRQKEISLNKMS